MVVGVGCGYRTEYRQHDAFLKISNEKEYIRAGMVVHNCLEGMAIVVYMTAYRVLGVYVDKVFVTAQRFIDVKL